MLLLIDNHDSFTYNLVQAFQMLNQEVQVVRNLALSVKECEGLNPSLIVISPGPGNPSQSGISIPLMRHYAGRVPILGVCLGHQCLAELHGGKVIRANYPMHGKTSAIFHRDLGVFCGIPNGFKATRYHSLIVERATLPECLEITAETAEGEIMGLRHKTYDLEGVQFHPESVLTEHGLSLLKNFTDKGNTHDKNNSYHFSDNSHQSKRLCGADLGDH